MRRSVEHQQGENVYIPHAVNTSEESGGIFQTVVLFPLELSLRDLHE